MADDISSYMRAVEIEPDFVSPHLSLGFLIKYKAGDPRIAKRNKSTRPKWTWT